MIHLSLDLRQTATAQRQGTVTYPLPGTPDTWTVAAALYPDYYTLAAAIQTAVRAAQGGDTDWTCTFAADTMTLEHDGDTFAASFPNPLQTHVGFDATYASTDAVTVSKVEYGWFHDLPYGEPNDVRYVHLRHWDQGDDTMAPLVAWRGQQVIWAGDFQYDGQSEVRQLRRVLAQCLKGRQFRLWPTNAYVATEWSETNRTGYLDLRLIPTSYTEGWLNEPAATLGSISIEAFVQ